MRRREWLQKNPPPKVAATLRELLEQLTAEKATRERLETNKAAYGQHVAYWSQQQGNANNLGDMATVNYAKNQLKDAQDKIAEIDKQLAATAQLPGRIAELQKELSRTAKCPTHQTDLLRHKNRPDDLFLCHVGPHFFLWTKVGTAAQLSPIDINKPLPEIDGEMDWIS